MKKIIGILAAVLLAAPAAALPAAAAETNTDPAYETRETLSCIGSVSKMFATTAVMQLVDAGKVELDAPVTEYLPEFRMADPRYKDITVRMLMNHSSGIMGTTAGDFMLFDDRDTKPHDTMLAELRTQRLKADPGDFGAYCNDGFEILELITERVSGQSFTDYIEEHITKPLGMEQTGTPWNAAFRAAEQVPTFTGSNIRMAADYCMDLGSGGILSTAPELCRFGSSFFRGDTTLLSEASKQEMATAQTDDKYEDGFGLGWDMVGIEDYDNAGVQIVSKGGDVMAQHAALVVAPEEEISVAVLTSGGSSMFGDLMALSLIDIALDEKGITVDHPDAVPMETLDTVPEKYLDYADIYIGGSGLYQVSFPDAKYMEITCISGDRPETTQYLYTTEDNFVEMDGRIESGKAVQAPNQTLLHFGKRDGKDYILADSFMNLGRSGKYRSKSYSMQRADHPDVSADAQAAWDARNGKKYYLWSAKYSNCYYAEMPCTKVHTYAEAPGFMNDLTIVDADHVQSALCMPGGRDLRDGRAYRDDGIEYLEFPNLAMTFISEEAIPVLPDSLTEVELHTKQATWYRIGEAAGKTIRLEIPEHAAVYVYDAYDRMTYSSYMLDYGNAVPLPEGGKIVFLGEDGGTVTITQ